MKCPKCGENLNLLAEESLNDFEVVEVRAECSRCGYWSYVCIKESEFMVEELDHPIQVLNK